MAEDRFFDFDAAWAERSAARDVEQRAEDAGPIVLTLFGRPWELPSKLPAAGPLAVARLMADGRNVDTDLNDGELLNLATKIIPEEILHRWLGKGMDMEQLGDVIVYVLSKYMGKAGEDAGEAPAPDGASASSSSNAGDSSKPTSLASTAST
jgi:hypothetical protein